MTIGELIQEVRVLLTDTEEPYLWEDSELLSYVKDTIRHATTYTNLRYTYDIELEISEDDNTYDLASDIIYVSIDGVRLKYLPYILFTRLYVSSTDKGKPSIYTYDNGVLYLYPIPDDTYTLYVTLYPSIDTLDMSSNIPFPDSEIIKHGTMFRAYLKQDSETFNGEAALKFEGIYIQLLNQLKNNLVRDSNILEPTYIHRGLI